MAKDGSYKDCYMQLPDGTIKMRDPFTGTVVRVNKERAARFPAEPREKQPISPEIPCFFCPGNEHTTPPEKSRVLSRDGEYIVHPRLDPDQVLTDQNWEFRRIPNLFEIVPFRYWGMNYHYEPSDRNRQWEERYLASDMGKAHLIGGMIAGKPVIGVVNPKLKSSGRNPDEVSEEEKLLIADAFFSGAHELIIPRRHFREGATYQHELHSSGDFTPREHFEYMKYAIGALSDIYENNRYVRFVNVFQNWLDAAGASVKHLHKQLVGNDEWGENIEGLVALVASDPNVFNSRGVNLHSQHNLVFAENEHAIAYAAIGTTNPAIVIFSKSKGSTPMDLAEEELNGFSDILHGCHAAMGSQLPNNEQWFYTPKDSEYQIPFHVQIDWRLSLPAGLEYISRIYIALMGPEDVRDKMVPELHRLKDAGRIAPFKIERECQCSPNCLRYVDNSHQ